MNNKQCNKCGSVFSSSLKYCPQCGTKIDKPFYKRWWVWAIVVVVVLAAIGNKGGSESKTIDKTESKIDEKSITNDITTPVQKGEVEGKAEPTGINKTKKADITPAVDFFDESIYSTYNYNDIERKPDEYKGKNVFISGEVIQVQEFTLFGTTSLTLRVNEDGDSDKTWYVTYTKKDSSEERILEDDYVTIYGVCEGVESYTALLGNQVTIPSMEAEKIEFGKKVGNTTVAFDSEEIISNIKVTEYSIFGKWSNYYIVEVENPSVYDIDLTINVKYYDSNDGLIGVDSMEESIEAGGNTLMYDMPDEKFDHTSLEYEVKKCTYSLPVQSALSYEVVEKEDKLIVTVKNNSEDTVSFVEAQALFFKGDTVVDYSSSYINDSDYEIKPGKECSDEIDFDDYNNSYDNYKIFISGTKN